MKLTVANNNEQNYLHKRNLLIKRGQHLIRSKSMKLSTRENSFTMFRHYLNINKQRYKMCIASCYFSSKLYLIAKVLGQQ